MAEIIRDPRLNGRQLDLEQRMAESLAEACVRGITAARAVGITACQEACEKIKSMAARPEHAFLEPAVLAHETALNDLKQLDPKAPAAHHDLQKILQMVEILFEFWAKLKDFRTAPDCGQIKAASPRYVRLACPR